MKVELWPQVIASSISFAAVLIPISLAWVIIFRTTKVLNFASGQYALLGAYVLYVLTTSEGMSWWLAAPLAVLTLAVLGSLTYVGLLRPLQGRERWTPVILTMGVAFVLDALISMKWGAQTIFPEPPVEDRVFSLPGDATLNTRNVIAIVLAVIVFTGVLLFLRYSRLGTQMRAAAELPLLAAQSGINTDRTFALGWALSCGVAAIGGITYTMTTVLEPTSAGVGVLALTPVLLGGLDSVGGVALGSIITALVANFTVLYLGAPALNATASVLLLAVLIVRPYGIFGTPQIERV